MTPGEPLRIVVAKPGTVVSFLPDEDFQRQIDADRLDGLHQRRAAPGVAEHEKVRRTERQTDGFRTCGVTAEWRESESTAGRRRIRRATGLRAALIAQRETDPANRA